MKRKIIRKPKNQENLKWYVSGFCDGEAYFMGRAQFRLSRHGAGRIILNNVFGIQLRADDEDVLKMIRDVIGDRGTIGTRTRKGSASRQMTLSYQGMEPTAQVVAHFDKYPLFAKKSRDYKIWSELSRKISEISTFRQYNIQPYTLEQLEERLELVKMCDEIRLGKIDKSLLDTMTKEELLHRQGASSKTYVETILSKFHEIGEIDKRTYERLLNKYSVKI